MRLTAGVPAGLILALAAGGAQAEDWRAVSTSHHDVVFVDSDSVRRQSDGLIAFRARHHLNENDSNRDFGYDRIDLAVTGRCQKRSDAPPPAQSVRKYYLGGRPIPARDWREEDLVQDVAGLAEMVCRGLIGYRTLPDLDRAMTEYGRHDSLERLAAYVTGEVALTGTVIQGFEMNAVTLCGSEAGCREDSPSEFCWLNGDINVPAPAGAAEWVDGGPRRDSAGAAFTGRIYRSRTKSGFGHMGGMACLVEVTGSARFVELTQPRPPRVDYGAPGRRPKAVAAHAALAESIKAASSVNLAADDRHWTLDELSPAEGGGGACYSLPRFRGVSLGAYAPALGWPEAKEIRRDGAAVTIVSDGYEGDLDLHLAHAEAAQRIAEFVRRLSSRGIGSVAQKGPRVTIRYSTGSKEDFRFTDAAQAVQAAGIADGLVGLEVATVKQTGNRVAILSVRRQRLTFPDQAGASEALPRMEALRSACAASATSAQP